MRPGHLTRGMSEGQRGAGDIPQRGSARTCKAALEAALCWVSSALGTHPGQGTEAPQEAETFLIGSVEARDATLFSGRQF